VGTEEKPQVPPLRFAPVGMTILWDDNSRSSDRCWGPSPCNKIVIPTGAKRSGGTCGFSSGSHADCKTGPNAKHKGKPRASLGDVGKVNPQHFGILLPFIIE
jgi:hypothetical protein